MRFNKIEKIFSGKFIRRYEESVEKTKNLTLWAL